ncbi:MAG: helix-turn-helix domain-containing protein [Ruminococcus sp.]|nr:helix-turn-helix domain-containing protein [Ruminococcus sp.]
MSINEKIYNLRKKKNMSQEDLAGVLNVSRQTISKWETGESTPDFDKIVPLCDFFEITTDELLKGTQNNLVEKIETTNKKNTALTFSLCILIFWIMAILTMLLEEAGVNDTIIASVAIICIASISIILVNYFCTRSNDIDVSINKTKKRLISKIINLLIIIVYLIFSFIFDSWLYSWIIIIIGLVIKRIIELVLLLKEQDYEK